MTKPNINITPVTKDQLFKLRDLMETTFMEAFEHLNAPENIEIYKAQNLSKENVLAEMENKNSSFYFVYFGDEPAGYLKLNIKEAQTDSLLDNALEIERIYLLNAFQGKGLGKALFAFAEGLAVKGGYSWLWLGVWEKNDKAIEFYTHHGLDGFATHDFLMGHERQTDILMKKAISAAS